MNTWNIPSVMEAVRILVKIDIIDNLPVWIKHYRTNFIAKNNISFGKIGNYLFLYK